MNESNVKILYSDEYGLFRFLSGNRDMNESKINNIIKSVESGLNIFRYNPIMVNEQFFIIDGQHRFMACKKLKHPVYYVMVPAITLRQIADINNNQSRWKISDFMNCYIDANVNREDYKLLKEFVDRHRIPISTSVNLLMFGMVGSGGNNEAFRNGEFKVKFQDFAEMLIDKATDYSPFCKEIHSRSFLQAIETLHRSDKYDHAKVIEKFKKHDLKVEKQSSYKEYLKNIEELFNYRNSIRQIIY